MRTVATVCFLVSLLFTVSLSANEQAAEAEAALQKKIADTEAEVKELENTLPAMKASPLLPAVKQQIVQKKEMIGFYQAFLASLDATKKDVPRLLKQLDHKDKGVRVIAMVTLGRIGPPAKDAIPALIKILGRKEEKTGNVTYLDKEAEHDYAAGALAGIGKPAISALIEAVGSQKFHLCKGAMLALMMIGPEAKEAVPAVAKAAISTNEFALQATAGATLKKIDPEGKATIQALADLLTDEKRRVRLKAAKALAQTGPKAKDAVPALIKALADKEEDVQQAAIEALCKIDPSLQAKIPELKKQAKEQKTKRDF